MMRGLPVALLLLVACAGTPATTPARSSATVEAQVRELLTTVSRDLARDGPPGWLPYFLTGGEFFMASDGAIAFRDYQQAADGCRQMAHQFGSGDLEWSNVRVQPLSEDLAAFGADYREVMQQRAGSAMHFEGYVTGVAVRTLSGWQLQHLHWSRQVSAERAR